MIALVAAGQGSQSPRMTSPWLRDQDTRDLLTRWSRLIGVDVLRLGTEAAASEIVRTENTQPLLVAHGLLALPLADHLDIVAGHSVGELTAAVFAGVLSPEDALHLAVVRGAAMAEACREHQTGMAAVIGGDQEDVVAHLASRGLVAANLNGGGQVVAGGPVEGIERLVREPLPGTIVKRLAVAGAFHTSFMDSAQDLFAAAAAAVTFHDATRPMVSNRDGALLTSGDEIRQRLVSQITAPVRWDLCLATIADQNPSLVIAAPPGRVLSGLIARQAPQIRCCAVTTPRDMLAAQQAVVAQSTTVVGTKVQ